MYKPCQKLQCYTTMIRPIYTYIRIYMPTLSGPHTPRKIKLKLKRVQRQSARFIMADCSHHSSVTNMLTNLKLPA